MQENNSKSSKYSESTALVMLNTRNIRGYQSVREMIDKTAKKNGWGTKYAFLHIPIPKLSDANIANPLEFIWKAHKQISRKKSSWATPLTGMLLNMVDKLKGPEVGKFATLLI
jgi:hypothetical protein